MADAYSTFGKYLLLKRRSEDALGTLWRAGEMERTGFQRIVWLRRFDQHGMDRAALVADMATANQLAPTLKATNVVRNPTYGSEGGVPFIAWDYVPAQPLDQLMARVVEEQFPVAIDNALLLVEKLAAALAAASAIESHGEPLAHGFLVPALIVVGNDGEALVGGFGLSRGFRANLERPAVRTAAAPYLAPEVLAGEPASARADVYSLGAILFQLLTGTALPGEAGERGGALERPHMAFEEEPVPQDVLAILRQTLAARPEDRYPSPAAFKRELEKLLYGGAYAPTTFNLALFMDRLYRGAIEEEDRELERERTLDVAPYYQPPKAHPAAVPPPEPAVEKKPGKAVLYAAVGAAVVLLSVIAYLLISRPAPPPVVDQEAQKRMLQDLVNTQVAQALKEKEDQLRRELEAEKAKTEELRQQLAKQKQGAPASAREAASGEQLRLQRELEAREAEQKRKEDELARVKQQQADDARAREVQAQAARQPVAASTAAPAVPTAAPVAATAAPVVPTAAPSPPPTATSAVAPTPTVAPPPPTPAAASAAQPARDVPLPGGLGGGVREGDLVDFTRVDSPPQVLTEGKVVVPRAGVMTRVPLSGYVILKVLVDEKGEVDKVETLRAFSPPRPAIDEACIEAVKQNRYKPAMKSGQRVKTWITVTKQILIPAMR